MKELQELLRNHRVEEFRQGLKEFNADLKEIKEEYGEESIEYIVCAIFHPLTYCNAAAVYKNGEKDEEKLNFLYDTALRMGCYLVQGDPDLLRGYLFTKSGLIGGMLPTFREVREHGMEEVIVSFATSLQVDESYKEITGKVFNEFKSRSWDEGL